MAGPESLRVIVTEEQIRAVVARLGREISRDYRERDLVLLGVLNGSFVFLSDLVRSLDLLAQVEFLRVSSYGAGTTSSGQVRLLLPPQIALRGRDVLLVEDIVDSGATMSYLLAYLRRRRPASLRICTMFIKEGRTSFSFPLDYVGMVIPDEFVVGYGLDHAGNYRGLPDLRALETT